MAFADWQLIVLTHDQQFFEHLSRRAPSWRKLELTSWSYAAGPRTTQYETRGHARRPRASDSRAATCRAPRPRHAARSRSCSRRCARRCGRRCPFRRGQANDKREIGELFKGLRRALKEHARPLLDSIEPLLKHLEADVGATLNVAAHASRGRSAASEVRPALERIEALDGLWSCPACRTRVWHEGTPEAARCRCGREPRFRRSAG